MSTSKKLEQLINDNRTEYENIIDNEYFVVNFEIDIIPQSRKRSLLKEISYNICQLLGNAVYYTRNSITIIFQNTFNEKPYSQVLSSCIFACLKSTENPGDISLIKHMKTKILQFSTTDELLSYIILLSTQNYHLLLLETYKKYSKVDNINDILHKTNDELKGKTKEIEREFGRYDDFMKNGELIKINKDEHLLYDKSFTSSDLQPLSSFMFNKKSSQQRKNQIIKIIN